jgi:hypothetical protein
MNDIVWALNHITGEVELRKVRWTDPEYNSARIIFKSKFEDDHMLHMSDDIPLSSLTVHQKYHEDPNAFIMDLLRPKREENKQRD